MSRTMRESRNVPVALDEAFETTLTTPLDRIFHRRHLALPPVRSIDGPAEHWGTVGQSRIIHLADGGTMHEELTEVRPPSHFDYRIVEVSGAFTALVDTIDGRWGFEPVGTGTRVTWTWTLHPRGPWSPPLFPAFERMWRGYARRSLERLEDLLLG